MGASRSGYLIKNTAVFAISNIGTRLISFFLVPLYTYTLSVSDYGVADLVTTLTFVLAPILTLNLSDAVMRFPLDRGSDHNKILTVGIVALVFASIAGLAMVPMVSMVGLVADYVPLMYLYCIATAASSMFQAYLRGLERLRAFAFSNILCTALTAGLNILFLVFLGWGVFGYLLAYVLAMFATALYAAVAGGIFGRIKYLSFDKRLFFSMAKYSIVLIPNTFMWWIIHSSDRVVVAAILGTTANGLLAVAYKIPSIVSVLSNTFTQAWSYSAIREEESEDRDSFTSVIFNNLLVGSALVTAGLLVFIEPITRLYVSADYASAWLYSSWLLAANYVLTLASFLGASYSVHKDSVGYLVSGTIGALVNIGILLPLTPCIGLYGTAFATIASYIAVFIFRFVHTRKYVSISVDTGACVRTVPFLVFFLVSPYLFGDVYLLVSTAALLVMIALNRSFISTMILSIVGKVKERHRRGTN